MNRLKKSVLYLFEPGQAGIAYRPADPGVPGRWEKVYLRGRTYYSQIVSIAVKPPTPSGYIRYLVKKGRGIAAWDLLVTSVWSTVDIDSWLSHNTNAYEIGLIPWVAKTLVAPTFQAYLKSIGWEDGWELDGEYPPIRLTRYADTGGRLYTTSIAVHDGAKLASFLRRAEASPDVTFEAVFEGTMIILFWAHDDFGIPIKKYIGDRWIPAIPPEPAIPGQPGSPASLVTSLNPGWNATSRGIPPVGHDGAYRFNVPKGASGVVCGLYPKTDATPLYSLYTHGIYFTNGKAEVIENGVLLGSVISGWDIGSEWKIERTNGRVAYLLDDTPVYASDRESRGNVTLHASLYLGGDYVDNPERIIYQGGGFEAGPAAFFAAESDYAGLAIPAGRVTFTAAEDFRNALAVGGVRFFGAEEGYTANLEATIGGAAFSGEAGMLAPKWAALMIPQGGIAFAGELKRIFRAQLRGESGGIAFFGMEDGDKGVFALDTGGIAFYGQEGSRKETDVFDVLFIQTSMEGEFSLGADFASALEVDTLLEAELSLAAEWSESLEVSTLFKVEEERIGEIYSELLVHPPFATPDLFDETWALNLDNNAVSTYCHYPFNSFAKIAGKYYGASPQGLFILDGHCDDGEEIEARVGFGREDFGTLAQKTMPSIYLGVASTDAMRMLVVEGDSGREFVYEARGFSPQLKEQRVDVGRGLRANWFDLTLLNAGGADFELDRIEFLPVKTTRRIK